jgi:hypothetical protein
MFPSRIKSLISFRVKYIWEMFEIPKDSEHDHNHTYTFHPIAQVKRSRNGLNPSTLNNGIKPENKKANLNNISRSAHEHHMAGLYRIHEPPAA